MRSSLQSLPNLNIGFGTTAPGAMGGGCLTTLCATTELVNLDGTNKWPENFLMLPANRSLSLAVLLLCWAIMCRGEG